MKEIWLILKDGELVVFNDEKTLPPSTHIKGLMPYFLRQFGLGSIEEQTFYVAELDPQFKLPAAFQGLPFRKAFGLIPEAWHSLFAKAISIVHWDQNNQYCGCCGQPTSFNSKGLLRVCSCCSHAFYPRISPSIIVLIQKEDKILMARSSHFLPGIYSLIAGFIEVGESVEEAVHREVKEEVGICIKNLRYYGSQSWPFPDSLMLGFFADHAAGDIQIDHKEIESADWYSIDKLPGYPPSSISIATKMIQHAIKILI